MNGNTGIAWIATVSEELAQGDIEQLRRAGCDDGEILEVNQVVAYFNYSNRALNGLGATTPGDTIG